MRSFRALALVLATLAGGCVVAKTPVEGPGERAAPFSGQATFAVFERADGKAAWKPAEKKTVTLTEGADRTFRSLDDNGDAEDGAITFHALGPNRYLVQAPFGRERYGFAVLEVRGGEGLVSPLICKAIDPDVLKNAGVMMVADDCWLEDAGDPTAFLKAIAAQAPEPTVKYVPVKTR